MSEEQKQQVGEVFLRLKTTHKRMTRLQQASINIFIRNVDEDRLAKNKLAFMQIDADNSGQLD